MSLKLYKFDLSPPARACMMGCDILKVPVQMVDVAITSQEHKTPEYLQLNPLHTVPVLEDDDLVLHDSHAILMYLFDKYGKDESLYPREIKQRALVNQKLLFNNSILFPNVRNTVYAAVYEGVKSLPEKLKSNLQEAYGFLEEFLNRSKYLAGETMTIADLSAVATISTLVYILPLETGKYPKIEAWMKEMQVKDFYQKYNSPGAKALGQWLQGMLHN